MRVTVVRAGGFAGLVVTTALDSSALDTAGTATLRELVDACSFTDRRPSPVVDGVRVELVVDDGERTRRVRFDEHDPPEGAGVLLDWLLDHPAAERTVGR